MIRKLELGGNFDAIAVVPSSAGRFAVVCEEEGRVDTDESGDTLSLTDADPPPAPAMEEERGFWSKVRRFLEPAVVIRTSFPSRVSFTLEVPFGQLREIEICSDADVSIQGVSEELSVRHDSDGRLSVHGIERLRVSADNDGDIDIEGCSDVFVETSAYSDVSVRGGAMRRVSIESNGDSEIGVSAASADEISIENNSDYSVEIDVPRIGLCSLQAGGDGDFEVSSDAIERLVFTCSSYAALSVRSRQISTISLTSDGDGDIEVETELPVRELFVRSDGDSSVSVSASRFECLDAVLEGDGELTLEGPVLQIRNLQGQISIDSSSPPSEEPRPAPPRPAPSAEPDSRPAGYRRVR